MKSSSVGTNHVGISGVEKVLLNVFAVASYSHDWVNLVLVSLAINCVRNTQMKIHNTAVCPTACIIFIPIYVLQTTPNVT